MTSLLSELPSEICDWASLTKTQDLFRRVTVEEQQEWVFRGVADGTLPLRTTLEEVSSEFGLNGDEITDVEVKMIHEFMRHYQLYGAVSTPVKGDTLEWMALMRHHGAPSRLLDFTFSFLVGTYFAIERKSINGPSIWAINKSWLTRETFRVIEGLGEPIKSQFDQYARYRDGNEFRNVFLAGHPTMVTSISPYKLSERLTIQQGIFLCPGNVTKPFVENLHALIGHEQNVKRIPISVDSRAKLLDGLLAMNLSRATLFPGLDGFTMSLWTRVPLFNRLYQMELNGARTKANIALDALATW